MSNEIDGLGGLGKLLDILKASGWQTAAGAAAFGASWWMLGTNKLPPLEPAWLLHLVVLGFLLFLCLTLVAIASTIFLPAQRAMLPILANRALARRARKEVPFMTAEERAIVGFLLHHKQKVFDADQDGGFAASLISRGFVRIFATRGQLLDLTRVPMIVPDPVWDVWERNKAAFPYEPHNRDSQAQPWRVPWMLR